MTLIETDIPVVADGRTQADHRRYFAFVDDRPDWLARGSVAVLLVATAFLYIWGLSASGYANSFYSAAARGRLGELGGVVLRFPDGGNSITVDKPPAAIWLMALSVRLFGLSSWSILVPEALLGVASVGVLYSTVRRSLLTWRHAPGQTHPLTARGAHWAALAGAAVFALTPVATLMFRFNNPDALLVFTMVLPRTSRYGRPKPRPAAGWRGRRGHRVRLPDQDAAGVRRASRPRGGVLDRRACGLAQEAAGPVRGLFWPCSPRPVVRRDRRTDARVPAALHRRSQTNSLLELILSYNGSPITGNEVGSVGGSNSVAGARPASCACSRASRAAWCRG